MSQSQPKPINIWLYILLSIPPFICLYPLKKLKKVRIMFAFNLAIVALTYLGVFLFSLKGYQFHNGPTFLTTGIVTVTQCICVYNWGKEHNKKIQSTP